MSRQSLTQSQQTASGSAFFPALQKEMNRLFEQFRTGFPMSGDDTGSDFFSGPSFPAIDVVETEDAFDISAEVPGVSEEDLDVSITGQTLILKGKKSADHEEKEDNYHLIERRYGSFRRQIPLGFTPEVDAVESRFGDGVLKLHITKPETVKADVQKIDIKKS